MTLRAKLSRKRSVLTRETARVVLEQRYAEYMERKKSAQAVSVRRGINENTLSKSPRFYGFLQNIEGVPINERALQDPQSYWYLQFECVDADWMDRQVEDMRRDGRFESVMQFLRGRPFDEAWTAATHQERYSLSYQYQRFAADLLKMNPTEGIYECLMDLSYLRQSKIDTPKETQWFELILVERPDDPDEETHGYFFFDDEDDDDDDDDENSCIAQAQVGRLRQLEAADQAFLTALNFPNFEPPEMGDPPIDVDLDSSHEPPDTDMEDEASGSGDPLLFTGLDIGALRRLRERLSGELDRLGPWLQKPVVYWAEGCKTLWTPALEKVRDRFRAAAGALRSMADGLQSHGALGGVHGLALPFPGESEMSSAPLAYSGHPGPNTMATGGPSRPFVGVVNVGQGGLNVISDSAGVIQAYFDFGWTLDSSFAPTVGGVVTLPDLCFCDRPTIIISSLDADHVNMIGKMPDSLSLRWILPQEQASTRSSKRIAKITAGGGVAYLFPRGGARRHLRFPWGFVERCAGAAANRGGLAAFVCVEDGGVVGAPAVGTAMTKSSGTSAIVERGRAAVAAVDALPPPALNGLQTQVMKAVCAALGLCRHANAMSPDGDLFADAVRAAVVHALADPTADADDLVDLLDDEPFDELKANPELATRRATGHAIRAAADEAAAGASLRAQSDAAAAEFAALKANSLKADRWACLVWAVQQPAWTPASAPQLILGAPPFLAAERFVMLCGDAFCWDVPSLNDNPPPVVVGMQAGHHGSIQSDGGYLTTDGMPWAPGSLQSAAAQAAAAAPPNVVSQAAAAGNVLSPGTPLVTLTGLVDPAVTAVVNGLLDTYGVPLLAARLNADSMLCLRVAFTAAAAVISHTALPDYRQRGAGAILAGLAHSDACNPGSFLRAVTAPLALGAGITAAQLARTGLLHQNTCVQAAGVLQNLPAVVADNIAQATSTATSLVNPPSADDTLCVTTMTNCLTRRNTGAPPINVILRTGAITGGFTGYPATQADTLRLAALLTAAGVVAHHLGVPAETVLAAMEPGNVHAAAVAGALPQANGNVVDSGQIAYSYGVGRVAPYKHGYASISQQFGRVGHAHPAAVRLYESHGWSHRFNTSQSAHLNAVQGDPASPRGNVALSWDVANQTRYEGHYVGGAPAALNYSRTCATCGEQLSFNC